MLCVIPQPVHHVAVCSLSGASVKPEQIQSQPLPSSLSLPLFPPPPFKHTHTLYTLVWSLSLCAAWSLQPPVPQPPRAPHSPLSLMLCGNTGAANGDKKNDTDFLSFMPIHYSGGRGGTFTTVFPTAEQDFVEITDKWNKCYLKIYF